MEITLVLTHTLLHAAIGKSLPKIIASLKQIYVLYQTVR